MTTPRVAPVQLVTNALLEGLTAAGFRVGDSILPTDRTFPYHILYQIDDAPPPDGPPLTGPEEDLWIGFQITTVGSGRKQAQWGADKIRGFMTGRDASGALVHALPVIAGWKVSSRLGSTPGGVDPEGTAPNLLFNAPNRYILHVTPA